jgi:hypothetical protein
MSIRLRQSWIELVTVRTIRFGGQFVGNGDKLVLHHDLSLSGPQTHVVERTAYVALQDVGQHQQRYP